MDNKPTYNIPAEKIRKEKKEKKDIKSKNNYYLLNNNITNKNQKSSN